MYKILNIALLLLLFSRTTSCVKAANDDVSDTNLVQEVVPEVKPKTETELKDNPSFRFTPVIEWLNALGFIKKEEVLFLANEMLKQQRDVLLKEITTLKQRIETIETKSLSKEDRLKLQFILSHVEAYR